MKSDNDIGYFIINENEGNQRGWWWRVGMN